MAVTDREEFLKQNRFCVLGTVRRDGRPRLSPMQCAYHEGRIYISTTRTRGGGKNAKRDPRVTVCVVNPASTGDYVTVYGRVEVLEDEADSVWLFSLFRGEPLEGEPLARARQRIAGEGRVVLRITPEEFFPR
jgi:PPOX class probable F420-dependent enzyme